MTSVSPVQIFDLLLENKFSKTARKGPCNRQDPDFLNLRRFWQRECHFLVNDTAVTLVCSLEEFKRQLWKPDRTGAVSLHVRRSGGWTLKPVP